MRATSTPQITAADVRAVGEEVLRGLLRFRPLRGRWANAAARPILAAAAAVLESASGREEVSDG